MTQVALITGASRGLGAELAGFLAKQGYDLVLTARGAEALQATVRSLEKYGGRIIAVPGDVSQAAHRSRLVGAAESLGRLDLLVNNASDLGQSPLPSLEDYPLDTFQQVLQVNLIAPLGLVQIALPLLRSSGGMVINLSSDAAVGGYQGWGAYGVSKAALDLVSLTLSEELRGDNLAVVSVDPGDMQTEMHREAFPWEDISLLGLAIGATPCVGKRAPVPSPIQSLGGSKMRSDILLFERPTELQATAPAETRNVARDGVHLLVTTPEGNVHTNFHNLPQFLRPGDLLVVNASATLPASLPAEGSLGPFILNLSTNYGSGLWLAEPRWSPGVPGPLPLQEGGTIRLPQLTGRVVAKFPGLDRLWFVHFEGDVEEAMAKHGLPIRYGYLGQDQPLVAYQTVFARVPGSAEMPSAARPFTRQMVDRLRDRGVEIATILLHTGVSSLEVDAEELEGQIMYAEPFEVSPETHAARAAGGRVIAVGTTVVRALESAWDGTAVQPVSGFTRLYIHHNHGLHIVDGLLTGFHDPMASHLAMLYALAGEEMIRGAYREAVESGYLWHEFGDTNLILPDRQYPNQDAPGD